MGLVDNRKLPRKSFCERLPLPTRDENFLSLMSNPKLWVGLKRPGGDPHTIGQTQSRRQA